MLARLTPLALAALLAACAAPGLPPGPANLAPAAFAQVPPASPGAATMTAAFVDSAQLQRVVDEVLANNRDLRAAAARLKQAEALATAAGAQRLPSVGVGASASPASSCPVLVLHVLLCRWQSSSDPAEPE